MRPLFCALSAYLLFLVQVSLPSWAPDIVLVALVVFSLHEGRLVAALLGTFAGLCLDLAAPVHLGANMLLLTAMGYLIASLRGLFYRGRWSVPLLTLAALTVKGLTLILLKALPAAFVPQAVSALLTLALSPIAGSLLGRLFYTRWNPGSTD